MPTQARDVDAIMEDASQALSRMDYLSCETFCLKALSLARRAKRWPVYARILLPLQETRRQRRMIAAAGVIRLGSAALEGTPQQWLDVIGPRGGCVLLTQPHTASDARRLLALAGAGRRHIEVLLADSDVSADSWTIRSFEGPGVSYVVAAPPPQWRDCWLGHLADEAAAADARITNLAKPPVGKARMGPADFFIDASEQLGDAAVAQVTQSLGDPTRIDLLEQRLACVLDHEKLHQCLAEAALAVRGGGDEP